jgi:hypothetical protein
MLAAMLALLVGYGGALMAAPFQVIINHLGYDTRGSKPLVVQSGEEISLERFQIIDTEGRIAFEGPLQKVGAVAGWKGRFFHQGNFSALVQPGTYRVQVRDVRSEPFVLREQLLPEACLADLIYYFRIQRCSGVYDKTDRSIPFFGEPHRKRVDVHGGWYDASGDVSKYLGSLTESNYMATQQTPMAVWSFLEAVELLSKKQSRPLKALIPLLREEALYGADFLVRMQDPGGYFYLSVFDGCTKDPAQREICRYVGLNHVKYGNIEAAFREGGGMAIAALARVSKLQQSSDYTPAQYLAAAEKGFGHLLVHNAEYADDHRENIIDDYCALLAATELYNATKNASYLQAARSRAASLARRISKDEKYAGWWRADEDGPRPFFHVVEAGLPVVALARYLPFENDVARKTAVEKAVLESLRFELTITAEVANPFGYARQYVKDAGDGKRTAFFFPHRNETGYWWPGENSRLASLAAAALLGSRIATPGMVSDLRTYAGNQINWILGLNPFDICMLQGKGRNNPEDYEAGAPNPPGGICNGITSDVTDEQDIAFLPAPYGQRADWTWRWKEQWIPHSAWLVLALAAEAAVEP